MATQCPPHVGWAGGGWLCGGLGVWAGLLGWRGCLTGSPNFSVPVHLGWDGGMGWGGGRAGGPPGGPSAGGGAGGGHSRDWARHCLTCRSGKLSGGSDGTVRTAV